jgi:hypothetical protein
VTHCRNCRVDLSGYPLARDGFCVPSHATNDNTLEMEADEDATRDGCACGATMSIRASGQPPPWPQFYEGKRHSPSGCVPMDSPPDVYGGTL